MTVCYYISISRIGHYRNERYDVMLGVIVSMPGDGYMCSKWSCTASAWIIPGTVED